MITIHQPYICDGGSGNARLEAVIEDEGLQREFKLWYEVENAYREYLCTESADAFLLTILPLAANAGQDLFIEANVSPKLLYNTREIHIPFLAHFLNKKEIKIRTQSAEACHFQGNAVVTGCSLGVDSLTAIYQHIDPACQPEYRLTHLCLFNAGHLGNIDQEHTTRSLMESAEQAEAFASEVGLKLFWVNSNIAELVDSYHLATTQVAHYTSAGCALALQKFLGKYMYASSYAAEKIRIEPGHTARTEALLTPMMSTESVDVILTDAFVRRIDKTERISRNPLTVRYLNVCWSTSDALEKGGKDWYQKDKKFRNCGWCDKCMRTLLTLELYGRLSDYAEAFDLERYRYNRKDYIIKVVANRKYGDYYEEIYELMKEKHFPIPLRGELLRLVNVKDSKLVLWLWQTYRSLRRKRYHAGR